MIDVLNACGVDICIFGNHEADVPHKALLQRIHESHFVWVRPSALSRRMTQSQHELSDTKAII